MYKYIKHYKISKRKRLSKKKYACIRINEKIMFDFRIFYMNKFALKYTIATLYI